MQNKIGSNQHRTKRNLKVKVAIGIIFSLVILVLAGSVLLVKEVNNFFQNNYLQFNQVVSLQQPMEIKHREPIIQKIVLEYPDEIDTPLKKYICDKFGTYDCKTALAVAKAESGMREDAVGINSNGTIDVGVFQINSAHFKQTGCSLKEIATAEKNVDCAFNIWKASGWGPWVTYKNGSYLAKVE